MPKLIIYVNDYFEKLRLSIDDQLLDLKFSLINNRYEANLTAGKHQLSFAKKSVNGKELIFNVLEFWITRSSTLNHKVLDAVTLDYLYEIEIFDDSILKFNITDKGISVVESTCVINTLNESYMIDNKMKKKVIKYYAIPIFVLCLLVVGSLFALSIFIFYLGNYSVGIVIMIISLLLLFLFLWLFFKSLKSFKTDSEKRKNDNRKTK